MGKTDKKTENILYKKLWDIANDVRGRINLWDFKNYVLGTLFYKYISDNQINYIHKFFSIEFERFADENIILDSNFKDNIAENLGYYIQPSSLFSNVCQYIEKIDEDFLPAYMNMLFKNIEDSGSKFSHQMNGIFSSFVIEDIRLGKTAKARKQVIVDLFKSINSLDFLNNRNIDILGSAYEYLMKLYVSNSGNSSGEYFTPASLSNLLMRLATNNKSSTRNVYDFAAGSGGLLLKSIDVLGKDNIGHIYGQEVDSTTYNLCRMNMIMHGIDYNKFHIAHDDTLTRPAFLKEKPFETIVANYPFSVTWKGKDIPQISSDKRFKSVGVIPPKQNADYAFILHALNYLADDGTAAIICYPGILYRDRFEEETIIRKYLIENRYIDCVIRLPKNIFFGTDVEGSIIVLKKNKLDATVLFIDASNEYEKEDNKNVLSNDNIKNIIKLYNDRCDKANKARKVDINTLKNNGYKLDVNRYIIQHGNSQSNINKAFEIKEINDELEIYKKLDKTYEEKIRNFTDKFADNNLINILKEADDTNTKKSALWEVTKYNINIKSATIGDYSKHKFPVKRYAAKELEELETDNGDIKLLTSTKSEKYTSREIVCGMDITNEEIIAISRGGYCHIQYFKGDFISSDNLILTSLDKNKLDVKYLYFVLKNQSDYISSLYRGAGVKHPDLECLMNIKIPIPSLKIQHMIAELLELYEKEIEIKQKIHELFIKQQKSYGDFFMQTLEEKYKNQYKFLDIV